MSEFSTLLGMGPNPLLCSRVILIQGHTASKFWCLSWQMFTLSYVLLFTTPMFFPYLLLFTLCLSLSFVCSEGKNFSHLSYSLQLDLKIKLTKPDQQEKSIQICLI